MSGFQPIKPSSNHGGKAFVLSFVLFTIGGFSYTSIYLPYFSKEGKERQQKVIDKFHQQKDGNISTKTVSSSASSIENVVDKAPRVVSGTRSNNMWKNMTKIKQQQNQRSHKEEKS